MVEGVSRWREHVWWKERAREGVGSLNSRERRLCVSGRHHRERNLRQSSKHFSKHHRDRVDEPRLGGLRLRESESVIKNSERVSE